MKQLERRRKNNGLGYDVEMIVDLMACEIPFIFEGFSSSLKVNGTCGVVSWDLDSMIKIGGDLEEIFKKLVNIRTMKTAWYKPNARFPGQLLHNAFVSSLGESFSVKRFVKLVIYDVKFREVDSLYLVDVSLFELIQRNFVKHGRKNSNGTSNLKLLVISILIDRGILQIDIPSNKHLAKKSYFHLTQVAQTESRTFFLTYPGVCNSCPP